MARLHIANVSTQIQVVQYRMDLLADGSRDTRQNIPARQSPPIPAGRQIVLGGEMHLSQIDTILDQLTPYGLIAEIDIGRMPRGQKVVLVSSVGAPVRAETIRKAHDHNNGIKIADGALRRKQAAVAASITVENVVAETMPAGGPEAPMTVFEAGVEQEEQSPMGERRIEEGYRVTNDGPGMAPQAPSRRGRPRKAA